MRHGCLVSKSDRRSIAPLVVLGAVFLSACQSAHHGPEASPPPPKVVFSHKPLIDFSRGAGGFPLASKTLPDTADGLVSALSTAYGTRVVLPPGAQPVQTSGDYPNVDTLNIDVSNAVLRTDYKPTPFRKAPLLHEGLNVSHLQYLAWPINYGAAKSYLRIDADNVELDWLTDEVERGVLIVSDASNGNLQFHMSIEDAQKSMLAFAHENGRRAGYFTTDAKLDLSSDNNRSLQIKLRIEGYWLLLPATMTFTARLDVDDSFNAHFTNVTVDGNDVMGAIVANVVRPKLAEYNDKAMPIAHFASRRVRIRDFDLRLDDAIDVNIAFGSNRPVNQGLARGN